MYRNKHGMAKRALFRLYNRFPALARVKLVFLPFKINSFRKRLDKRRQEVVEAIGKTGKSPLFNHIEIETHNRCNGECGFCPVNRHLDPRPKLKMTDELFYAIIDQLRTIDYSDEVCLYSNNESLMDPRIEQFTAHTRERLPRARILLSTNGTLLTPDRYRALVDNVDLFYVNNYCDDFQLTPANSKLMELAKSNGEWWRKTHFVIRFRQEVMSSRGGQAPNKQQILSPTLPVGCTMPATQMIVRPDGKVSLCCNDAVGRMTLGDVARDGVLGAWHSEAFESARATILERRDSFELCRHCDTLSE